MAISTTKLSGHGRRAKRIALRIGWLRTSADSRYVDLSQQYLRQRGSNTEPTWDHRPSSSREPHLYNQSSLLIFVPAHPSRNFLKPRLSTMGLAFSILRVAALAVLVGTAYIVLKILKNYVVRSPLDNIPGPPRGHWANG